MRNVALDLGVKKIAYCEVAEGQVVRRLTVGSLETLKPLLGADEPTARVVIEACREAWHVHDVLSQWGNEVILLDTTRSRQLGIGQHGRKNDRIDAEVMARALERGNIPVAHLLSPHRRQLRREIGVRRALVEARAQYVTTIRGLLRECGIRLPSSSTDCFVERVRRTSLPSLQRQLIEPLLMTLETMNRQLETVDERLAQLCASEPVIALLTTAPGVGPIVAASFVSVIDEAGRFRRAHQVESYLGLVPAEDSSGGQRRLGSISKHGNVYVRAMLVQAAWCIVRQNDRSDPLLRWADALMERRGKKLGVVALARRLAGILWAMWRDGTPYDAQHLSQLSARGLRAHARILHQHAEKMERTRTRGTKHLEVTATNS